MGPTATCQPTMVASFCREAINIYLVYEHTSSGPSYIQYQQGTPTGNTMNIKLQPYSRSQWDLEQRREQDYS